MQNLSMEEKLELVESIFEYLGGEGITDKEDVLQIAELFLQTAKFMNVYTCGFSDIE